MYRNRFTSGTSTSTSPANGVYGSNKAGTFLKDAINGVDCLDIILMGDSNISSGEYGYSSGFSRVLFDFLKAPEYATALFPTGVSYPSSGAPNTHPQAYKTMLGNMTTPTTGTSTFVQIIRPNNSTDIGPIGSRGNVLTSAVHEVGTNKPKFACLEADLYNTYTANYSDSLYISDYCQYVLPSIGFYGNNVDFGGAVGTISTWSLNSYLSKCPSIADWALGFIAIPANNSYGSNALAAPWGNNYLRLYSTSSIRADQATGVGNTNCQYRVVHALLDQNGGKFSLTHFDENTSANRTASHLLNSNTGYSTYRTNGPGTKAYATQKLNCPQMPSTAGHVIKLGFDGLGFGEKIYGPFIGLWHSVIKKDRKGISITPFCATGGTRTEHTRDKILYSSTAGDNPVNSLLHSFLDEILNRQKENNNGTGKALVVLQSGINDQPDAPNFATNVNIIIDRIRKVWKEVGGDLNNLAFLIIPTHPTVSTANNWTTTYRSQVINTLPSLISLTEGKNTTIIDLEKCFNSVKNKLQNFSTANKLVLYANDGLNDSHLRGTSYTNLTTYPLPTSPNWTQQPLNGYDAVASTVIEEILNVI